MSNSKNSLDTRVTIGGVRFSYQHVFEPVLPKNAKPGDKPKYSVCVIVPKSNTRAVELIENAIEAAKQLGKKGTKTCNWGGIIPRKLETVWRDGDDDNDRDAPELYDSYYFNASCKSAPGVIDKDFRPIDPDDPNGFYSGCWGRAEINFFPINYGTPKIAAGLNNIQKMKDGVPLAGSRSAESAFSACDDDADMQDMDEYPDAPGDDLF